MHTKPDGTVTQPEHFISSSETHSSDARSDTEVLAGEFGLNFQPEVGSRSGRRFGRSAAVEEGVFRRCKDAPSRQRNLWVCSGLAARWSSGWRRGGKGLEYQVRRKCYASNGNFFFALMEKWIFFLNIFGLLSSRDTLKSRYFNLGSKIS